MKPHTSHFRLPAPEFTFADFTFPRWKATLPRGDKKERIQYHKQPICGPYYHAPKPSEAGKGCGFYLSENPGPFSLRWDYCDEINGARINHTGWWADEYQDQKIRGIVFRLPKSRGFLAGWTMGENMSSAIEGDIYETASEAAYAADSLAESQAKKEREYQREYQEQYEAERLAEEERKTAEELESALCSAE